ncbi:DUF1648 domain-containing protein [Prescottella subtropica]|uniref:DUF1648 domain-containing protein n=1 Tax=Prescottella subtropica TaxID=2545757 RepID=UPI0010FA09A5|nr:DUF1648 domain-containing protein [Prescottella subtropica]
MSTPTPTSRVVDPAGAVFGIVVPLLAAASGVALTYALLPRLPERLATHWSGSGGSPDDFMSPTASAWTMAAIVALVGGGCCAIAALAQAQLMMRRLMLLIGLAVTGLIVAAEFAMILGQVDLTDTSDVPLPTGTIVTGLLIGTAVGLAGAALLRDHRVRVPATAPPAADLPRGDAALPITDEVGMSTAGLAGTALAVAAPAALVCWLAGGWWPMGVYLPAVLLAVVVLQFRLVVDADGIRVKNLGMATIAYGVDELEGAKVEHVRPFPDFGGWGIKVKGRGNYGVVTRTGPAVVLTFASGDRLTVTTPKAEEIAGALNALADRSRR